MGMSLLIEDVAEASFETYERHEIIGDFSLRRNVAFSETLEETNMILFCVFSIIKNLRSRKLQQTSPLVYV